MDTAPTEMYTYCRPLALHAALPICCLAGCVPLGRSRAVRVGGLDVVDQYTWSQGPRVALSYAKGVARPCILTRSNQCGKVRGPFQRRIKRAVTKRNPQKGQIGRESCRERVCQYV